MYLYRPKHNRSAVLCLRCIAMHTEYGQSPQHLGLFVPINER